jgi:integrase
MGNHKVYTAMQTIRRTLGTTQNVKKALTLDKIRKIVSTFDETSTAARDKALLLLGFVGGLRPSELAAIRMEHLVPHHGGYTIRIPQSKTDKTREAREVEIVLGRSELTCPILALNNWLKIADIRDGFVLRRVGKNGGVGESLGKRSIGSIIKKLIRNARLSDPEAYAGHSLRAGFLTEASSNGASDRQIMRQTGHKSRATIDRYYTCDEQKDRQQAASKLGL